MKQLLLLIAFLAFCMPALAQEKETVKPLKELEVTLDTYDCQGERCFSILTYAFGHGPLPVGTEAKIEGETYETDIREAKKGTPLTIKLPNLSKELVGKKVKVKFYPPNTQTITKFDFSKKGSLASAKEVKDPKKEKTVTKVVAKTKTKQSTKTVQGPRIIDYSRPDTWILGSDGNFYPIRKTNKGMVPDLSKPYQPKKRERITRQRWVRPKKQRQRTVNTYDSWKNIPQEQPQKVEVVEEYKTSRDELELAEEEDRLPNNAYLDNIIVYLDDDFDKQMVLSACRKGAGVPVDITVNGGKSPKLCRETIKRALRNKKQAAIREEGKILMKENTRVIVRYDDKGNITCGNSRTGPCDQEEKKTSSVRTTTIIKRVDHNIKSLKEMKVEARKKIKLKKSSKN